MIFNLSYGIFRKKEISKNCNKLLKTKMIFYSAFRSRKYTAIAPISLKTTSIKSIVINYEYGLLQLRLPALLPDPSLMRCQNVYNFIK